VIKEVEERDVPLAGLAAYLDFYLDRARLAKDPSPLANFALTLAKCLTRYYDGGEKIDGGRPSYRYAMSVAHEALGKTMRLLSMYTLEKIG
jgi:arginyl-tRNA synthetase